LKLAKSYDAERWGKKKPTYSHWDKLPAWANYVAKDGGDGSIWCYEYCPEIYQDTWYLNINNGNNHEIAPEYIGELKDLPWDQSLIERMEEK
jgi:hypothetical protein